MKKFVIRCPLSATMSFIGGKWKPVILWYIRKDPVRFGELKAKMPECSLKMFTQQLKELKADGIVSRTIFPEVPLRVEYSMTEYGKTLLPVIKALRAWGVEYLISNPESAAADTEWAIFLMNPENHEKLRKEE
ncbi:MAG: winged helix-turn-helix transcriptional regulator [Bacteroidales bacterium]